MTDPFKALAPGKTYPSAVIRLGTIPLGTTLGYLK